MSLRSNKIISRFIVLIVLSLLLMVLDTFRLLQVPKNLITSLTTPVEYGAYSVYRNLTNALGFITFWKSGYQEIARLKQRNLELAVDADLVRKLKEENSLLRSQLAVSSASAGMLLAAKVVSSGKYLVIDKGLKDGIKTGQTVVLNNVLVGHITKTDDFQSKIIMPTDPDEKIVVISTKNRSRGLVKGIFGSRMELGEVLQADKIDIEETVETYGDEKMDSGLLVGKITKIVKSDSALFQKAELKPLLEYNKLSLVFVKLNKN